MLCLGDLFVFFAAPLDIAVAASRVWPWNSLPLSLRAIVSADCFTRNLLRDFYITLLFMPWHFRQSVAIL